MPKRGGPLNTKLEPHLHHKLGRRPGRTQSRSSAGCGIPLVDFCGPSSAATRANACALAWASWRTARAILDSRGPAGRSLRAGWRSALTHSHSHRPPLYLAASCCSLWCAFGSRLDLYDSARFGLDPVFRACATGPVAGLVWTGTLQLHACMYPRPTYSPFPLQRLRRSDVRAVSRPGLLGTQAWAAKGIIDVQKNSVLDEERGAPVGHEVAIGWSTRCSRQHTAQ